MNKNTYPFELRSAEEESVWVGRWREDVIENGRIRRAERSEVLGSKSDILK
jgi:hypothetical protein